MRRPRIIAPSPALKAASLLLLVITLGTGGRAQDVGGPVVGSRGSKVYHEPGCRSAERLSPENRIPFATPGAAEANGFRACKTCKPNQAIRMISLFQPSPAGPSSRQEKDDAPTFSADVAPVLVANCLRCHNERDRRGDLDMSTFRSLMTGTDAGPVISPSDPESSELLLRIKGESTPKMPPGNTDLAGETIARIEAWIAAGARLDAGANPNAPLAEVAVSPEELRNAALARLSKQERRDRLVEEAQRRWAQAGAPGEPTLTAGDRVLLFGTLPEARASRAVTLLDQAIPAVRSLLSRPGKPALGSPMEISAYVFTDRNHYAEFVRTVARQEPMAGEQARADLSGEAPYLAALDPMLGQEATEAASSGASRSLEGLLVEQLGAGAVTATDSNAPRWLALGYGALLAAKVEPRGAEVARLRAATLRAAQLGWTTKANEALGDVLDPEETRALGFSLLEWLSAANPRAVGPFVRGMLGGRERLDEGILQLFGASREQFLTAWGQWVSSRYARGR
ncbi:c-type cytochrome domain-containing protein [Tautonia sociabilis]|uniref:Planctomycete cytochrome C n=1 Tax=Tautonia sociabilis TaxID=2080755 RepID=A0A432MG64_9BACT|nr:c-type cytochrome domain-containing protein [Tautonia sociabilis]RUL85526.1 hypothetical protein TsocGM_18270 [Tautonia sociabilis]